jgi:hypothetical protein
MVVFLCCHRTPPDGGVSYTISIGVVALVREISKSNPRSGQPYVGQLSREVIGLFGESNAFGRLPAVFFMHLSHNSWAIKETPAFRVGGFHLGTEGGTGLIP